MDTFCQRKNLRLLLLESWIRDRFPCGNVFARCVFGNGGLADGRVDSDIILWLAGWSGLWSGGCWCCHLDSRTKSDIHFLTCYKFWFYACNICSVCETTPLLLAVVVFWWQHLWVASLLRWGWQQTLVASIKDMHVERLCVFAGTWAYAVFTGCVGDVFLWLCGEGMCLCRCLMWGWPYQRSVPDLIVGIFWRSSSSLLERTDVTRNAGGVDNFIMSWSSWPSAAFG